MQWAPPTFIGIEVNRLTRPDSLPTHRGSRPGTPGPESIPMISPSETPAAPAADGELSGIYFGILNIYSTIPQFMGAVMSGIVFYVLDAGKSPELAGEGEEAVSEAGGGPNAISVCLFIGALFALVSAYMSRQFRYAPQ